MCPVLRWFYFSYSIDQRFLKTFRKLFSHFWWKSYNCYCYRHQYSQNVGIFKLCTTVSVFYGVFFYGRMYLSYVESWMVFKRPTNMLCYFFKRKTDLKDLRHFRGGYFRAPHGVLCDLFSSSTGNRNCFLSWSLHSSADDYQSSTLAAIKALDRR